MGQSQFIVIPPLDKIKTIFVTITGRPFVAGVGWSTWNQTATIVFDSLRPYIRPCHQRLIDAAPSKPLPFLRQLLRPYGYRIDVEGKTCRLIGPDGIHGAHGPGATVTWA